jgi:hypothetical protein
MLLLITFLFIFLMFFWITNIVIKFRKPLEITFFENEVILDEEHSFGYHCVVTNYRIIIKSGPYHKDITMSQIKSIEKIWNLLFLNCFEGQKLKIRYTDKSYRAISKAITKQKHV